MRSNEHGNMSVMALPSRQSVLSSTRHVPDAVRTSVGIVVPCIVGLLLLRFMVLVAEARAMIVTERSSDDELMLLCTSGAARESAHMRAACMKATVDRASPALARALTRGAYAFASELYALFSEPFKACSLLGAVGVLSVLPWVGTLWTVLIAGNVAEVSRGRGGSGEGDHTVVILRNGEMPWDPLAGPHASLRFRPSTDDMQKGRAHTPRITELA